MSLEYEFVHWRHGSTVSERLVAKFLARNQDYFGISPQAPRGGYDNKTDIVFDSIQNGRGVCGCYFPQTEKNFSDIQAKFLHDAQGIAYHGAKLFVFVTGQLLTLQQKIALGKLLPDISTIIYDFEGLNAYCPQLLIDSGLDFRNGMLVDMQREADVASLIMLFQNCDLRSLAMACESSPRHFHPSFAKDEQIKFLLERWFLHFYEPTLKTLLDNWWGSWQYTLQKLTQAHTILPDYTLTFSEKEWQGDTASRDQYYCEITFCVNQFLGHYRALMNHIMQFYPEVLRNPTAAFYDQSLSVRELA